MGKLGNWDQTSSKTNLHFFSYFEKQNREPRIYKIICSNCSKKFYGQSRRTIRTQYGEHLTHVRYGSSELSSVAHHIPISDHSVDLFMFVKLVKHVMDRIILDACESLEIIKTDILLSNDRDLIPFSCLHSILK